MKRRKFLLGVGSTAAAGSALIGSGALSRVESDRSVSIQVAEDPNAYLGLSKCNTPNGSYVHGDGRGHIEILMDPTNPLADSQNPEQEGDPSALGDGVNSNSTSWFDRVFQICNQGKKDACVWIDADIPTVGGAASEFDGVSSDDPRVEFYLEDDDTRSIVGPDNAVGIPLGECICVGIKTRTYGLSDGDKLLDQLENEIQISYDVGANCVTTPPETITESGELSLAYEDLPKNDSDWDYNDWVVDIEGTFVKCGEGGSGGVQEFQWDIIPQARFAGDTHKFEFEFDCGGEYELVYYDDQGGPAGSEGWTDFSAGEVDITVWDNTSNAVDSGDEDCVLPDEWAQLRVRFTDENDDPTCCTSIDTLGGDYGCNGDDLPFNPVLENNNKAVTVEKGDIRLLVVEKSWNWPEEGVPIWSAYDGVVEDEGKPDFSVGDSCLGDEEPDAETVDCSVERDGFGLTIDSDTDNSNN